VSRAAVDAFLIVLGLAGAVNLLLAERERARREEPTPRAVDSEPVAFNLQGTPRRDKSDLCVPSGVAGVESCNRGAV
jgi:hypothetical protein